MCYNEKVNRKLKIFELRFGCEASKSLAKKIFVDLSGVIRKNVIKIGSKT